MKNYFIKPGYSVNAEPVNYCDSLEDSRIYQLEVYRHVGELARCPEVRSVLDIGCGMATKLVEFVWPHCERMTGADLPETIARCCELYTVGDWIPCDLEGEGLPTDETFDLIVSSDVIEHLRDPDRLLAAIRRASHESTLVVLSTPERDLRRGVTDMGPPGNPAHVREWNAPEFTSYLESRGFQIDESQIVDLREGMKTCQMVTGSLRGNPH